VQIALKVADIQLFWLSTMATDKSSSSSTI